MDKSAIVNRFASTPEQKILFAHILDIFIRAESRNIADSSNFMSGGDTVIADRLLRSAECQSFILWGGYEGAERKCAVTIPDYLTEEDIKNDPQLSGIVCYKAEPSKYDSDAVITHRDCLGALMALGIERETVGDIVIIGNTPYIFLKDSVAEYVKQNLESVGRYQITLSEAVNPDIDPTSDLEEKTDTVASMRLDGVCAAVFNLSRNDASDAVLRGLVTVNGATASKNDMTVSSGDRIALKGKGRVIISSVGGMSKKGRVRFSYKK